MHTYTHTHARALTHYIDGSISLYCNWLTPNSSHHIFPLWLAGAHVCWLTSSNPNIFPMENPVQCCVFYPTFPLSPWCFMVNNQHFCIPFSDQPNFSVATIAFGLVHLLERRIWPSLLAWISRRGPKGNQRG